MVYDWCTNPVQVPVYDLCSETGQQIYVWQHVVILDDGPTIDGGGKEGENSYKRL